VCTTYPHGILLDSGVEGWLGAEKSGGSKRGEKVVEVMGRIYKGWLLMQWIVDLPKWLSSGKGAYSESKAAAVTQGAGMLYVPVTPRVRIHAVM
jgi:hypothetical protein